MARVVDHVKRADERAPVERYRLRTTAVVRHVSGGLPTLETVALDRRERGELEEEPETLAVATPMPTRAVSTTAPEGVAWGVRAVGAHESPYDGAGVEVAILDSGIDRGHPAFAGVTIRARDFTGSGDEDAYGHGTHCAGIVFGRAVDGRRIGVAPGVERATVAKVMHDGTGDSAALYEGMRWVARAAPQVVCVCVELDYATAIARHAAEGWPLEVAISAGLEAYRENLAMCEVWLGVLRERGGAVVVAAAGNASRRWETPPRLVARGLPAAAPEIVSVGELARTSGDELALAGTSNAKPTVVAPGEGVLSADPGGGLSTRSGTSAAAPHVAGLAALHWQRSAVGGAEGVRARLLASARTDRLATDPGPLSRGVGMPRAPSC